MSEIDTSAEAVDLHLNQSAAAGPMADPAYTDNAGISIRTGWMRRNDALMRALAAKRDALQTARDDERTALNRAIDLRDQVIARRVAQLNAAEAERDAARAKAARLKGLLKGARSILRAFSFTGAVTEAIDAALAQKDAGHE